MRLVEEINAAGAALAEALSGVGRGVGLTGAGISTESGIPDFRSPGGLWTRMKPIEFADFVRSETARLEDWKRRFVMIEQIRAAKPNPGHRLLARLVAERRFTAVITQNIDGLHERAGLDPAALIELHGNGTYARCLDCGARTELDAVKAKLDAEGGAPRCDACGGLVKAAVVSFGQAMPLEAMERALWLAQQADLFLVLGSSLVVQPAASLPLVALRAGARLVIVNAEPTPLDPLADLVIRAPIGAVCESLD